MSLKIGDVTPQKIYCTTASGAVEVEKVYVGDVKIWSNVQKLARIKFEKNEEGNSFFDGIFYPFKYNAFMYGYITINGEQLDSQDGHFNYPQKYECVFPTGYDAIVKKGDVLSLKAIRTGFSLGLPPNKDFEDKYGEGVLCAFYADGLPGDEACGRVVFDLAEGEEAYVYDAISGKLMAERHEVGLFLVPLPTGFYFLKGNLPYGSYNVRFLMNSITWEAQATVEDVEYNHFD